MLDAVQLADRVWWVGGGLPDDRLQSHAYLIEQGDQSVLIDPGSATGFDHTRRKIEQVLPFSHIRWFVCHHPDPDVTSCLPLIDQLLSREDARLVCHRRAETVIGHYGLRIPFWLVDEHDWQLVLEDRTLNFISTPYVCFPGAFCSYDSTSRVLFSSHLFGGGSTVPGLFAQDESCFEAIRPWHEQYIASREVLTYALRHIDNRPLDLIAPQCGALIPEQLAAYVIGKLKELECGLYLMAREGNDIQRLSRLNDSLQEITSTMVVSRDFREIANRLLVILQRMLPAESLEFQVLLENEGVLQLTRESRFRGVLLASPAAHVSALLGMPRAAWEARHRHCFSLERWATEDGGGRDQLLLPLFAGDEAHIHGVALITLREQILLDDDICRMLEQMSAALGVAVERETIYRRIELERQRFYERSIRDALTGLFTRFYMEDTLRRLFEIHDRSGGTPVAMAMLDIDHFKAINDRYGHSRGDQVLREVAGIIKADARAGDLPVRIGGEEFGVIVVGEPATEIHSFAERLRQKVAAIQSPGRLPGLRVSVSIGTAVRQVGESIPGFIERADLALYRAKNLGRNRVCSADNRGGSNQWTLHFE